MKDEPAVAFTHQRMPSLVQPWAAALCLTPRSLFSHPQVDDAHAALAALLEQGSSNKLSPAEETPVARKALLRYLQTCM